uniref:Kinase n=1 Tax=Cacopsylla melanoneura TaxID=428564 RepID=A0A8D8XY52_9HEMI
MVLMSLIFWGKQQSTETWRSTICPSSPSKKFKRKEDNALLKFLALNALELTAPASDILLRTGSGTCSTPSGRTGASDDSSNSPSSPSQQQGSVPSPPPPRWFQLSGHPDCFAPAGPGTIWKKCSGGGERDVYEALGREVELRDIVPRYLGEVEYNNQTFIELQDLLHGFRDPHVMDIKMGTRTFLECEVQNSAARTDLYNKMLSVDPMAPSLEEHQLKAVTKLRYMQFREHQSSTSSHGFRIEAMKFRGAPPVTDLKTVRTPMDVQNTLALFLGGRDEVRVKLLVRLKDMRRRLEHSKYLQSHEIVGSSILIIYDECRAGAWLIDFAKTRALPSGLQVNHRSTWAPGNHEEGFLYGLDQLIQSFEDLPLTSPKNGLTNGVTSSNCVTSSNAHDETNSQVSSVTTNGLSACQITTNSLSSVTNNNNSLSTNSQSSCVTSSVSSSSTTTITDGISTDSVQPA